MNPKEIENILKLDTRKKYGYFIKKIADSEEVWSLKNSDGWVSLGLEDQLFFPVWAKKEYADLCIAGEWEDCHSEAIDIYEFIDVWIANLKEEGTRITVMWHNGSGIDVDWDDLLNNILFELDKY